MSILKIFDIFIQYQRLIKMNWKMFLTIFGTIFIAELGDKTQLATMAYAASNDAKLTIFLASASALTLSSLLGVLFGAALYKIIPADYLRYIASSGFIIIGLLMLFNKI